MAEECIAIVIVMKYRHPLTYVSTVVCVAVRTCFHLTLMFVYQMEVD